VAAYLSLHSLLPLAYFTFDRWLPFIPIITTILITKALDKKILAYLAIIFLVCQIIFFFVFPTSSYDISSQKNVAEYLSGKEGRIIYIPEIKSNAELDPVFDYLIPKYNSEYAIGFWPQGQSSKRYILSLDISMYMCGGAAEPPNLLDFSIRKMNPVAGGIKCTMRENASDELLRLQNVKYIIINNQFSDILSRFENDSNFTTIKQIEKFTIIELSDSTYIRINPSVKWNYSKDIEKIEINLFSEEPAYNVSVAISETWYPNWKSNEVDVTPDDLEYMTFNLAKLEGTKHITIEYVKPVYQKLGELIAVLSWMAIACFAVIKRKELFHLE
jgi:hypothetical protein